MLIVHPNLPGQTAEVSELSFELVWSRRGWIPAPEVPDLTGTVEQIVAAVGDDPATAMAVLAAEQDSDSPRTTLTSKLERIAASAATTENTGD